MRFADIAGNEEVVRALAGMVDSGKIPHAIMLHEDDGGGAFPIVQAFLQYVYCKNREGGDSCGACPSCGKVSKLIHPDVHYIYPVNTGSSTEINSLLFLFLFCILRQIRSALDIDTV